MVNTVNLLHATGYVIAAAGISEDSRMRDPVSSHTAAEHRPAVRSLEGHPNPERQGVPESSCRHPWW